jgi:hypothetical protein
VGIREILARCASSLRLSASVYSSSYVTLRQLTGVPVRLIVLVG